MPGIYFRRALGAMLVVAAWPGYPLAASDQAEPDFSSDVDTFSNEAQTPTTETIDQVLLDDDPAITAVRAQIEAQEFDESIAWLQQHIELLEEIHHRYDPVLIEPITLLGDAHTGKGEHEQALNQYQRATHLSRVNYGLNTAKQVSIVYREANAFKAMQDYVSANDREEYAYHVLTRTHGAYDAEMLPGVYHLATWYSQTNNIFAARTMYEHALNILSTHGQANTPMSLPAYRGIADSYRLERFPPIYMASNTDTSGTLSQFEPTYANTISVNNFPAAERALQQVIAIYREDPERYSQQTLAEGILDLADWYLMWDKYSRAHPLYEYAYKMIDAVEGVQAANVFAAPKMLHFPAPQPPKAPPARLRGPQQQGVVEVSFSVTKNGHVREMKTEISQPEGMMDFRVRKSLRQARFRPILAEGVPAEYPSHRYQYNFAYFPRLSTDEPSADPLEGSETVPEATDERAE